MIIAHLSLTEHEGRRTLSGTLCNVDAIRDGTPVVLKREGDEYHLRAIVGFPACRDPQQGVLSFVLPDNE
jgi:hypothetical protein